MVIVFREWKRVSISKRRIFLSRRISFFVNRRSNLLLLVLFVLFQRSCFVLRKIIIFKDAIPVGFFREYVLIEFGTLVCIKNGKQVLRQFLDSLHSTTQFVREIIVSIYTRNRCILLSLQETSWIFAVRSYVVHY